MSDEEPGSRADAELSPAAGQDALEPTAADDPAMGRTEPAGPAGGGSVAATASRTNRRRWPLRWLIAEIVVLAAIGGTLAVALILGSRPLPEVLRYVPADSAVVLEIRPELPGDQRQHLGNFLAHLPGFADQSTLPAKIDESLDRIIRQVGDGAVDYASQVKPLLAGPMVISISTAGLAGVAAGGARADLLIVATTDGTASCSGVFGATTPGETHRGIALQDLDASTACALDGRLLLLGSSTAIDQGIDAKLDGTGIDKESTFLDARERIAGDVLAQAYLNGTAAGTALASLAPSLGLGSTGVPVAGWLAAGLRVQDDALQLEVVSPPGVAADLASGVPTDPPPATSHFASLLPSDAFGFVEAHGMGANIQRAIAQLGADPGQAATLRTLEQALASAGGVGALTGWIEDLGVAGVPVGDGAGAVILVRGTDAAVTKGQFDQLRNLLSIASIGSDISVRTADHNGLAVTTVDLGDLGPTLESLGAPSGILPSGSHVTFTMAVAGDVLMLGIGDGAIERVLDTDAGHSLAASGTYDRAIELGGSPNDVEAFVAVESLLGWLTANPPSGFDVTAFDADFKPYLEHLAGAVESNVTTSTGTRARIVITVK